MKTYPIPMVPGPVKAHPAVLEAIRSCKPAGEEALLKMYGVLLSKCLRSPGPVYLARIEQRPRERAAA